MNGFSSSDEHQPVTWWRGHPIYAADFVVVVFVASMLVTTLLLFLNLGHFLGWLEFTSDRVLRGEVWRLLSYGLINPPSLWFAVDMVMIVWFGREVEKSFGHRKFLRLFAGLYLLSPVLFTVIGAWLPMRLAGATGAFALFIAFATIYPNVPIFFNLLAKWVALILVGIYTLMALANRSLPGLLTLWTTAGFAYAFVRYEQGHLTLPKISLWRRKPKLRVLPDPIPRTAAVNRRPQTDSMTEVDALLDKIAHSGLSSLTAKERARLEAARADLLKRESGRP